MDYAYTLQVTLNVIFIALYGMTFLYIKKLETIGCDCSNHKYRNFIKYFPVAAIAYIVLFNFFSPKAIFDILGQSGLVLMGLITFLFGLVNIVFFVFAFIYARYMMVEKCKCSEESRRDVLYWWSLLEIAIIVIGVILLLLTTNILNAVALTVQDVGEKTSKLGYDAVVRPVQSIKKMPSSFAKVLRK
jgi:hypothetical protein